MHAGTSINNVTATEIENLLGLHLRFSGFYHIGGLNYFYFLTCDFYIDYGKGAKIMGEYYNPIGTHYLTRNIAIKTPTGWVYAESGCQWTTTNDDPDTTNVILIRTVPTLGTPARETMELVGVSVVEFQRQLALSSEGSKTEYRLVEGLLSEEQTSG